ncbi:hypothetical protein V2E24_01170 [Mycoplasmopsis ciconiae]|uniref:Preprotein translocase subunit SecE n=1 Tax=Mycoplasmopsis ciconiae TaxID=561067 RepID=A0ABU7MKZ6_9BACT|nr:hypothetical protein [Mycoplasmopsis ciconiae]
MDQNNKDLIAQRIKFLQKQHEENIEQLKKTSKVSVHAPKDLFKVFSAYNWSKRDWKVKLILMFTTLFVLIGLIFLALYLGGLGVK